MRRSPAGYRASSARGGGGGGGGARAPFEYESSSDDDVDVAFDRRAREMMSDASPAPRRAAFGGPVSYTHLTLPTILRV